MDKIKVLHIINSLHTGGAESMLLKLIAGSDRTRFEHLVYTIKSGGALEKPLKDMGVRIHCLNHRNIFMTTLGIARDMTRIRRENPHIIQGWLYHSNCLAYLFAKLAVPKAKLFFNIRGSHVVLSQEKKGTALIIRLCGKLSKHADTMINNSQYSAEQHVDILKYSNHNTVIIGNGFQTDVFRPSESIKKEFRRAYGIDVNGKVIGHIARFDNAKDQETLIKALSAVKDKQVHFVFAGPGLDKDNPQLTTWLETYGILGKSILLGEQGHVHQIMPVFDIFMLTSIKEGFPNVLGEAMSCEVPCIATDVGDSAWIVGDTGMIAAARDVIRLTHAVERMITMAPSELKELGRKARERINRLFHITSIIHQYENIYVQSLGGEETI